MMKLYNTLNRKLEEISVSKDGMVHIYNCGPTVYSTPHIGNLRAFVVWDVLARALRYSGVKIKRVMNITDVGHMTSDEDWGEDKMEMAANKEGVTPLDIANMYIYQFLKNMEQMNIQFPDGSNVKSDFDLSKLNSVNMTRATDYVKEMIALIEQMQKNGYVYETEQAIYFDISKYPEYSKLSGQILEENMVAVRDEVNVDTQKKHPADFVLWMKASGFYATHTMQWDSPWGKGFPGWHIECSAMGGTVLENEIDIHTGGVEHIGVHHPNERAQNFGASQKEIVKMWVHNEHLQSIEGDKLSKSKGNAYLLSDLIEKGFDPMDLRLLLAINNYRVPLKFSLDVLKNTQHTRLLLVERIKNIYAQTNEIGKVSKEYKDRFIEALNNDLNVSVAFAILNEVLKSNMAQADILATVLDFDNVFALNLEGELNSDIPEEILTLVKERETARSQKDYAKSDSIRNIITEKGYKVNDISGGKFVVSKVK